jgi:hypothetical protein
MPKIPVRAIAAVFLAFRAFAGLIALGGGLMVAARFADDSGGRLLKLESLGDGRVQGTFVINGKFHDTTRVLPPGSVKKATYARETRSHREETSSSQRTPSGHLTGTREVKEEVDVLRVFTVDDCLVFLTPEAKGLAARINALPTKPAGEAVDYRKPPEMGGFEIGVVFAVAGLALLVYVAFQWSRLPR